MIVNVPATSAQVDSSIIIRQIPVHQVIDDVGLNVLINAILQRSSPHALLSYLSDEAVCDYIIDRGYNIEM